MLNMNRLPETFSSTLADIVAFPGPFLLNRLDFDQCGDIRVPVQKLHKNNTSNGLLEKYKSVLQKMLHANLDLFCTSFSARSAGIRSHLHIGLRRNSHRVKLKVEKYSHQIWNWWNCAVPTEVRQCCHECPITCNISALISQWSVISFSCPTLQ